MEYLKRLQRALDHVEAHLEGQIELADLARAACYSRSHFIWLFECVIGFPPMEYVRKRRLAAAAAALDAGAPIMDTALRFGFSSQDAFTRSFHDELGMPPGRYRAAGPSRRMPQTAIRLRERGESMRLRHLVASYTGGVRLEMERFLDDEAKSVVALVAAGPRKASAIEPGVLAELVAMRALAEEEGRVRLATSVFLESDMNLVRDTVDSLSARLAAAVEEAGAALVAAPPEHRCYAAGILGMGQALTASLNWGQANPWKDREGRYGHARVDFDELCDAYDAYGPDLMVINTNRGEERSAVAIGPGRNTLFGYLLDWRLRADTEDERRLLAGLTIHLTDAFALQAAGGSASAALERAAAAAHLWEEGAGPRCWIGAEQARAYADPIRRIAEATGDVCGKAAAVVSALLARTTAGRQGVSPAEQMVNFTRYVRKLTARRLYDDGYLTDQVPSAGSVAVFYPNGCAGIDVMA
jgi:AraC-like DNA-binding protein